MRQIFPVLIMILGVVGVITGMAALIWQLSNPQFDSEIAEVPTTGHWGEIQVEAPAVITDMPIMPVMEVEQLPSFTPTASPTISLTTTATFTPSLTATQTLVKTLIAQMTPTETTILSLTPTFTFTPTPTVSPTNTITPTPTFTPIPRQPARIIIPSINVDAPIQKVWLQRVILDGQLYSQWRVPNGWVVGWHETSAMLGEHGNTVLNGHHNTSGRVFRDLVDVQPGDMVKLIAVDGVEFEYIVVQTLILPEDNQPMEQRLENARWLLPSNDERITMVTCWPPSGRTHRLVVIALPSSTVESGE